MRKNTVQELQRITYELLNQSISDERANAIVDEFSFERQAGRKPGEENKNSFLRKGLVGDWKNHFNTEAREIFEHYAGTCLVQLGYEQDHSWIKKTIAQQAI